MTMSDTPLVELSNAVKDLLDVIAEELGIYKLLDWISERLER